MYQPTSRFTLGALSGHASVQPLLDYGRDLLECGVKVKSAAIKMKNLLAMPTATASEPSTAAASSHDDVLSFHKNITFGQTRESRSKQFQACI